MSPTRGLRPGVVLGWTALWIVVPAAVAGANDTCHPDNPADCSNTAGVIGVAATAAATAAVAASVRNGKPSKKSCDELRARDARLRAEREKLMAEVRDCQSVLGQIRQGIAQVERDHEALVAELEGTLPYFIGAGALAGAALASAAGAVFGAIGRTFTSAAQAVGSARIPASLLMTGGRQAVTNTLTGEVIVAGEVGAGQAIVDLQMGMVASNLARARYWLGLVPRVEAGAAAGAGAGALSGNVVQRLMDQALAEHKASLDRHYAMERDMEQSCGRKRERLAENERELHKVAEGLRRCGDSPTEPSPGPAPAGRPTPGMPPSG